MSPECGKHSFDRATKSELRREGLVHAKMDSAGSVVWSLLASELGPASDKRRSLRSHKRIFNPFMTACPTHLPIRHFLNPNLDAVCCMDGEKRARPKGLLCLSANTMAQTNPHCRWSCLCTGMRNKQKSQEEGRYTYDRKST